MKKLALLFLSLLFIAMFIIWALAPNRDMVSKTEYLKVQDSIETLKIQQIHSDDYAADLKDSMNILNDSIENLLLRPLMTKEQFLQLYKYERLEKYYRICKNNPVQWKYYKGWSTRVFEQK